MVTGAASSPTSPWPRRSSTGCCTIRPRSRFAEKAIASKTNAAPASSHHPRLRQFLRQRREVHTGVFREFPPGIDSSVDANGAIGPISADYSSNNVTNSYGLGFTPGLGLPLRSEEHTSELQS